MSGPRYVARSVGGAGAQCDTVTLTYDARMLRRKVLPTDGGESVLVDLPEVVSLEDGDALRLEDGGAIIVRAAEEELLRVTGDLPRLAWHIGNRHAPCEIHADSLILQRDKVMRDLLERLGATVTDITAPFRPEGGAYGVGRTMGHNHSHSHA